jgi:16S rRNA processing protein RimM
MASRLIEIGAVASAHGIKGQFKVKAFCDDAMAITSYGAICLEDGKTLSLMAHSTAKGFVLCSAREITSRTEAEALRGSLLYIARDQMPEPESDEIYHADLIGYDIEARGQGLVGTIIGIFDFGAGTVIEIKRPKGKAIMVPFATSYQPEIDDRAQKLVLDIADEWLDDTPPKKEA